MIAKKYNSFDHSIMLKKLMKRRELNSEWIETTPKHGIVVLDQSEDCLLGAGFIRICEGEMGLIESFITNPEFPSHVRNEVMLFLTSKIIDKAKELNLTVLMGISLDTSIIMRAKALGFSVQSHTIFTKAL